MIIYFNSNRITKPKIKKGNMHRSKVTSSAFYFILLLSISAVVECTPVSKGQDLPDSRENEVDINDIDPKAIDNDGKQWMSPTVYSNKRYTKTLRRHERIAEFSPDSPKENTNQDQETGNKNIELLSKEITEPTKKTDDEVINSTPRHDEIRNNDQSKAKSNDDELKQLFKFAQTIEFYTNPNAARFHETHIMKIPDKNAKRYGNMDKLKKAMETLVPKVLTRGNPLNKLLKTNKKFNMMSILKDIRSVEPLDDVAIQDSNKTEAKSEILKENSFELLSDSDEF